jgi:hypothetical protein
MGDIFALFSRGIRVIKMNGSQGARPAADTVQHPESIKKSNILISFADKINIYL